MHQWLIGIHAALGEIGSFGFLWVFVELLGPTAERLKRAQWAALTALVSLVLSWIVGGYYYVTHYGAAVKPVIKQGATPWAHLIVMEVKEHVFIFLPFMAYFVFKAIRDSGKELIDDRNARRGVLCVSALLFLVGMSMAGMGYVISFAFRTALEKGVSP